MTAWARIAQENSEQSCGNDGAMESQHQAFHSSLGISQKMRDSHIPTAPATGCLTGTKRTQTNPTPVYTKVLTPPSSPLSSCCPPHLVIAAGPRPNRP